MADHPKLYMILLGASVAGRNTEQHDVFFSIGNSLSELVPAMQAFWPEAKPKLHIDAWRQVTRVDGFEVSIIPKSAASEKADPAHLFFINLGGYKPDEFEEFHYKMIVAATDKQDASRKSMQTAFYKHTGISKQASSHIDDRFGIDVDEMFAVADILSAEIKEKYTIQLSQARDEHKDELNLGYYKLNDLSRLI